jgi:L-lysine 2,3-aminomutase
MVLLRGINDDAATVETLNRWLLRQRCRPYYILQCDPVGGTAHLRTPVRRGRDRSSTRCAVASAASASRSWSSTCRAAAAR